MKPPGQGRHLSLPAAEISPESHGFGPSVGEGQKEPTSEEEEEEEADEEEEEE